jgi:hypothetical protein
MRKLAPAFLLAALLAVPVGFGMLGAELVTYGWGVCAATTVAAVCCAVAGRRTV